MNGIHKVTGSPPPANLTGCPKSSTPERRTDGTSISGYWLGGLVVQAFFTRKPEASGWSPIT